MKTIQIFLVDDHNIVRQGIRTMLEGDSDIEIIGEACDGTQLFQLLKTSQPDVVIMDIAMPGDNGITLTHKLAERYPAVKVIILTANDSDESVFKAFKAGARAYLPKNARHAELTLAIRTVMENKEYLGKTITDTVIRSYIRIAGNRNLSPDEPEKVLTEREEEVLKYIAEGFSHKEIADMLSISIRTVETHKFNLMQKLDIKSTVELVKFAIKHNIIEI